MRVRRSSPLTATEFEPFLRGAASSSPDPTPVIVPAPAVSELPAMAWTLDALRARCGELKVNVRRNTNTAAYREGRSYGLAEESMATYIDNLRANNAAARSSYLAITNLKSLGLDDDIRRSALMP